MDGMSYHGEVTVSNRVMHRGSGAMLVGENLVAGTRMGYGIVPGKGFRSRMKATMLSSC